ncbi:MAG: hypothetical protein ABGW74_03975 [Campylobacterales bacterium]
MLKWKIINNVISELEYDGKNIIKPWGFETADSSAFFSLEKDIGWRYKKLLEEYKTDDTVNEAHVITQMKEGKWELHLRDEIQGDSIIREIEATTLEDGFFMDFVMRYRFKKEFIEYAEINDTIYYHKNTDVYYQFPVDKVFLKGKGFNIDISILDSIVPDKMEPVMYIRDNRDEWVVHVRMIPKRWDKEVIKICTRWAVTRPLPHKVTTFLLKWKWLKEQLWYRGERKPYGCWLFRKFVNPCAFGMVKVPKDAKLMWKVKMDITKQNG